ncbi:MAG: S-formylglutathione hydrolase [Bdellovibrionota bacterium]
MVMELASLSKKSKSFGGWVEYYQHASRQTKTTMRFSVFRPPQAEAGPVPVLYWLSGLTCTEENFTAKSSVQKYAAEHGLLVVAPDTSPRGASIPGEDKDWDFGTGAGFYVNATEEPWAAHYRMDAYVTEELPALIEKQFPVKPNCCAISGHSMGGHGALVAALRNPGRYRSVSAFAPICAPSKVPWGEKAFSHYLGSDREKWKAYDACELIANAKEKLPLLVDQGTHDSFLKDQLKPELLKEACEKAGYPLELRMQEDYDHSYFFIATFIGEHIAFHAKYLKA